MRARIATFTGDPAIADRAIEAIRGQADSSEGPSD